MGRGYISYAHFGAKNFGYFEIYGVSAPTRRGFEPLRTFCKQEGGINFSRFCADALYGRSLTDKINCLISIKADSNTENKTNECQNKSTKGRTVSIN